MTASQPVCHGNSGTVCCGHIPTDDATVTAEAAQARRAKSSVANGGEDCGSPERARGSLSSETATPAKSLRISLGLVNRSLFAPPVSLVAAGAG